MFYNIFTHRYIYVRDEILTSFRHYFVRKFLIVFPFLKGHTRLLYYYRDVTVFTYHLTIYNFLLVPYLSGNFSKNFLSLRSIICFFKGTPLYNR